MLKTLTSTHLMRVVFGMLLEARFLYPLYNSPLRHLFSDPQRHWENGLQFLHPSIMGSDDPYLYQLWMHVLQWVANGSDVTVLLGCGLLCALMPYGWYRALRELLPVRPAIAGAILIGLVPDFLDVYGYFMTESLLLSLTGFAFWLTFRAYRKRTVGSFVAACAVWLAATFTRSAALPLAAICLVWVGMMGPRRAFKMLAGVGLFCVLVIPAGLHGRAKLGYFAPFGNLYLHQIYRDSGNTRIELDFGPEGQYWFESPSFANPTFYPFSDWLTSRSGSVRVSIDLSRGRADWIREHARVASGPRSQSRLTDTWENMLYLGFGQPWPNNDLSSVTGWLTMWLRWVWVPLIAFVTWRLLRGGFRGQEKLLPVAGVLVFTWLGLQQSGIVEGRFRLPLEPIFLAAALVAVRRMSGAAERTYEF